MTKPRDIWIPVEAANRIYDILVSECNATPSSRDSFVAYLTRDRAQASSKGAPDGEWRFGGGGGKFYFNRWGWRIDWYSECMTDSRKHLQGRVQIMLDAIRDGI